MVFGKLSIFLSNTWCYSQWVKCYFALLIAICFLSLNLQAASTTGNEEKKFWQDYQTILNEILIDGNYKSKYGVFQHNAVNYTKYVATKSLHLLDKKQIEKLKKLKEAPTFKKGDKVSTDKYLAFWLNVYNFYTLYQVKERMLKETVESMKDIGWDEKIINVAGRLYTLDDVEHKQIRLTKDSRIHFAANCASVSCPTLNKQVFNSETINNTLNELVKSAFKNPLHLRVNKGFFGESLYTTKLFSWYKEDWGSSDKVLSFIKNNQPKDYPLFEDYSTGISYDWNLNSLDNIKKAFNELRSEGYLTEKL